ncbi:MAG: hypothetical protein ILO53_03735, partial [Clostridia bacterium]|nr:hypothetical protein [Clostridia bacterium]
EAVTESIIEPVTEPMRKSTFVCQLCGNEIPRKYLDKRGMCTGCVATLEKASVKVHPEPVIGRDLPQMVSDERILKQDWDKREARPLTEEEICKPPSCDLDARHIFYNFEAENEFFAEKHGSYFTDFLPPESFDLLYRSEFSQGGGYYVIFVGERHSVFEGGVCIYQNTGFTGDVHSVFRGSSKVYSIYLAKDFGYKDFRNMEEARKNEYYENHCVCSWNQNKMYVLDDAIAKAKELSAELNCRTAVVRLVEDYNMR